MSDMQRLCKKNIPVEEARATVYISHFMSRLVGCKYLGAMSNIDVCEVYMRNPDLGNELKNGAHSNFPYTFPNQVV